ncbi:MAG: hypothetical protein K5898_16155 [Ruminococcus sp.]|uniref:hypothetical protein n=1 Tax=Ruminococcus sp. TaxID=41978 RepID=UPI002600C288|nr:hypothetical protein [Ruminococcus sp.]MCR4796673.1 hypothetical protein [Ruminococcus sp.]
MDIFRKKEKMSDPDLLSSYTMTDKNRLCYRKITNGELAALPKKYTSLAKKLVSPLGLGILLCIVFILGSIYYLFTEKDTALYMRLMVFVPLDLFVGVLTYLAADLELRERITTESMVIPGVVVKTDVVRSGKTNSKAYTVHTVAIHGTEQLVSIKYRKLYYTGQTVLIVRKATDAFLVPISADAAEHDKVGSVAEEFKAVNAEIPDYQYYEKIDFYQLTKYTASDDEYKALPEDMRSCRPLGRGLTSITWLISLVITLICLIGIYNCKQEGNIEKAIIIFGVMFVSGIMLLMTWGAAFRKPLAEGFTTYADGIIIDKNDEAGRCFFTMIFPDSQQYIQSLETERKYYEQFGTNERVRVYFNEKIRRNFAVYVSLM